MSQNPPPPPNLPPSAPMLRPDTGEGPRSVLPIPISSEQGGCRGCLWGCGGGIGFLIVVGLLCGGLIFATGRTVGDFVGEMSDFFSVDLSWLNLDQRARINIPDIELPDIERIQALSALTTVRYNYANIITAQSDMPALLDRLYGQSLVLLAVSHIDAGIDLGALTADALSVSEVDGTVTLRLPAPTIQDCFLNEVETSVIQRTTGVFAQESPELDNVSRRFAISQFLRTALEDGILQEAATNSELIIAEFLQGFAPDAAIIVTTAPIDFNALLPTTCAPSGS